jgi:hypothetical protein
MRSATKYTVLTLLLVGAFWHQPARALTANQVAFEFRPNGLYRVYIYYTVPALKEFREANIEFTSRKKAEKFYFDLLRGADFYLNNPEQVTFVNKPLEPQPW